MLKTSTIVACVLALSGSAALAQSNSSSGWMPPGPNNAQSNKQQSAAGMPAGESAGAQAGYVSQAQAPSTAQAGQIGNPNTPYLIDEYGYQYNTRGDRIGRVRRH